MTDPQAIVVTACQALAGEPAPTLLQLAQQAHLSTTHFHRLFKQTTGLTPKQYSQALREQRLRGALHDGVSVTDAIVSAGYSSSSRFYEKPKQILGMQARRYQNGGAELDIRFAVGQCSLGAILVAQSGLGICAILLGDDAEILVRDLQDRFKKAHLIGADREFEQLVATVVAFVDAPQLGLDLPLDIRGTAFQQRVWRALRQIPPGSTVSYAELAQRIGMPRAVRAVAGACAANPLAVAVPCHRVIRNDGGLSGYRWGIERKRALLACEAGAQATKPSS